MAAIPEDFSPPIAALAKLPAAKRNALLKQLKGLPRTTDGDKLAALVTAPTGLKEEDAKELLNFLLTIFLEQEYGDHSRGAIVNDVVAAIPKGAKATPQTKREVTAFLNDLLQFEAGFAEVAKAYSLKSDYPHNYQAARIVTDLRPVFAPLKQTKPIAFTVQHTLRITHAHRGELEDFFCNCSEEQLRKMQGLIERALTKGKNLRETAKGLPFFEE